MSQLLVYEDSIIRRVWLDDEKRWYYAIIDIVAVLSGSRDPSSYWQNMKRTPGKRRNETVTGCHMLKVLASDGIRRRTECAELQRLRLIIGRFGSPEADSFRTWLEGVDLDLPEGPKETLLDHLSSYERMKSIFGDALTLKLQKGRRFPDH